MRGEDRHGGSLFSHIDLEARVDLEARASAKHPLRAIRAIVNQALAQPKVKRLLSAEHFSADGTLIEA